MGKTWRRRPRKKKGKKGDGDQDVSRLRSRHRKFRWKRRYDGEPPVGLQDKRKDSAGGA